MPSAKFGAAPLSRQQADLCNSICKANFRHADGPGQWSRRTREQLVKDVNRQIKKQRLGRGDEYNLDKLEMWMGNSMYRYRLKQRNKRPTSWEMKSKKRREAMVAKAPNQQEQPDPPLKKRRVPAVTQAAAIDLEPVAKRKRPEPEEPSTPPGNHSALDELRELPWDASAAPAAARGGAAARTTPQLAVFEPVAPPPVAPKKETKPLPTLTRLCSANGGGTDWWLPFRPSATCPCLTPELLPAALAAPAEQEAPTGNRPSAHVPAFPPAMCKVTRSLETLLDARDAELLESRAAEFDLHQKQRDAAAAERKRFLAAVQMATPAAPA